LKLRLNGDASFYESNREEQRRKSKKLEYSRVILKIEKPLGNFSLKREIPAYAGMIKKEEFINSSF